MQRGVPKALRQWRQDHGRRHARTQASKASQPFVGARSARTRLIAVDARAVRRLLSWLGNPPVAVQLYGVEEIPAPSGKATVRVLIRDRLTLWKLLLDPAFQFGEAYAAGRIEVEGNLTELLSLTARSLDPRSTKRSFRTWLWQRLHRPRSTTLSESRLNIAHHYDIGNRFYQLWLDERMVYTCAYFSQPALTLEEAQAAKMDHVCRKLRLRAGQTVTEAGCGWGALALHMATHYGVTVKAFNISHEQVVYSCRQARQMGLEHRVEFIEDDWRNMRQPCDAFVSIGMLEHVGTDNYQKLGQVIHHCLKPEGYGLIHTIGQNCPQPVSPWTERRIFPGAYPPTLRQMMDIFEPHDFAVLDVENLRLHYVRTLQCWLDRFEQVTDAVRQMYDEQFVRMWRLYLCGSIAGFETGALQLFQVLFTRSTNNQIPWTREYVYSAGEVTARAGGEFAPAGQA